MRRTRRFHISFALVATLSMLVNASLAGDRPDDRAIHAAVARALPLLETGAKGSMQQRKRCFTCHNQGLPIMALTTARDHGFSVDADQLDQQLQFTADFLAKNRTNYRVGKGQGGQALTAGYALWTLDAGGWEADETTEAVVEYLLKFQDDLSYWKPQTVRPPTEASLFTTSYVALRGMRRFGSDEQQARIAKRVERVSRWILETPPKDTEDRIFRLWALELAGTQSEELRQAVDALVDTQCDDGGWAQLSEMQSDAYATGTALVALHRAGGLASDSAAYRRGLEWLVDAQLGDGSWHVQTRSKPIQTYYESGFPHGEDQFISITATGWATIALADALPKGRAAKPGK